MKIRIRTFGLVKDLTGWDEKEEEVEDDLSVGELMRRIEFYYMKGARSEGLIVLVNGKRAPENQALKEGDEVAIIPPPSGG
ncbi:MoaD/ThiS family protein [Fervidicoccus fontis]|uniref:MoaD/ThiS family protein n=1 Tax=Fervidicoccus fontis TaxID=683846 RepID=A0A843A834_9CREN|nr:MoaD/ThiS family protein [Fervidicoccus fontis]MBE9390855.1 MoaD/ThiS family protein [Fervidicoccus fontis]